MKNIRCQRASQKDVGAELISIRIATGNEDVTAAQTDKLNRPAATAGVR
jgi:hypothetical protein